MTTDVRYLAYTALLTAALWVPYVIAQVTTNGFLAPPNYADPTPRPVRRGASAPTVRISMPWSALRPLPHS